MRLLNTSTLEFTEYFDEEAPDYAIVSHRWLVHEITYQDLQAGRGNGSASHKKVVDACATARKRGHDFIWMDTVCLDQKSSSEMSAAINAMYRWYQNSRECLAHLADVPDFQDEVDKKAFLASEWFTRGWTLQELLAPQSVIFFTKGWVEIGTKNALSHVINQITKIDRPVLEDPQRLSQVIIAKKMSWVSRRKTTRGEDMSYSLFGLFDVNLPLLYGEGGKKAFFRLQLEILKNTRDDSIFAWTRSDLPVSGMLAPAPSAFADSGDLATFGAPQQQFPWNWTNLGLELRLPHYESNGDQNDVTASGALDGASKHQPMQQPIFGNELEVFTLSCWKTTDPEKKKDKSHWRVNDGVINIRLKRYGASWRRVNCTKLLLGTQHGQEAGQTFQDVGQLYAKTVQPNSYRLLYVK